MRFDGVKGLVAEIVLDPAGVLGGGLFIHAEIHEQPRQHGMALIDPFGQRRARLREGDIPRFVRRDETFFVNFLWILYQPR